MIRFREVGSRGIFDLAVLSSAGCGLLVPDPELVRMWYDWISGPLPLPSPPSLCCVCVSVCVYMLVAWVRAPSQEVTGSLKAQCTMSAALWGVPSCWVVFWIPSPSPAPGALPGLLIHWLLMSWPLKSGPATRISPALPQ